MQHEGGQRTSVYTLCSVLKRERWICLALKITMCRTTDRTGMSQRFTWACSRCIRLFNQLHLYSTKGTMWGKNLHMDSRDVMIICRVQSDWYQLLKLIAWAWLSLPSAGQTLYFSLEFFQFWQHTNCGSGKAKCFHNIKLFLCFAPMSRVSTSLLLLWLLYFC